MIFNTKTLCGVVILLCFVATHAKIDLLYKWKSMSYLDVPDKIYDESNFNRYKPESSVPMSSAHYKGRLFVSVPRRRYGVPSTLNYIDLNLQSNKFYSGPPLRPYPDFETNDLNLTPSPDRITSVYRPKIDACHRLWFVDTGVLEIFNNLTRVQNPSLWIMDLETNQRVRRFEIPDPSGNFITSLMVDVQSNNCDDAFAYIPNLRREVLWVYSFRENKLWSFTHNYFSFDPLMGDFNLGGLRFKWGDGMFSIALGPIMDDGYRQVYFHAMASIDEFTTNTRILRNESLSARGNTEDFTYLGRRGQNRQCNMHALDLKSGVMIYSEMGRSGFGCWNTKMPFSAENHDSLAQNNETMFYPADLTIDDDSVIWAISNRMPKWIYGALDYSDYNFRVFRTSVKDAITGTRCDL